jgi:signal transduction histidine kinase
MRELLKPPLHETEQDMRARMLFIVAWGGIALAAVFFVIVMVVQPSVAGRAMLALAGWSVAGLGAVLLAKRGYAVGGAWFMVAAFFSMSTALAYSGAGIRNPGINAYYVVVLMAGLLLGERAGVAVGIAGALAGLALVLAERVAGPLRQAVEYEPVTLWLLNVRWIGVTVVLMHLITRAQRRALERAEAELAERRQAEQERERVLFDLKERVKELRLLHAAQRLLRERAFHRDVLAELVLLIPQGWMYPECCEARIVYRDVEVVTPGWRDTSWRQSASFATDMGAGAVEVVYTEERPTQSEGPFLAEERALIDSLAEILEAYLERDAAERRRQGLELQLRQAQKMDALGTLAGGIAHDFNNILTAIGGNAELAQLRTPQGAPTREYLDEIARAHVRASDLVERILLFSRRQEPERRVIQVEDVALEALELLRSSLPPMIEARATIAADLPPVFADPTQIHQIVMNLGTNAGHAMQETGGVLSLDVRAEEIGEATGPFAGLQPGRHVCIAVSDTGTGMSGAILDRLFEPFFSTKGAAGTGLGLSVVHGIVRDHGGEIAVDSELGRGSRFRVCLPASTSPRVVEPAGAHEDLRGNGEHVMYVDDEEAVVFLMTRMLRLLGYECTGFTDASDALHAFRTNPHDFRAVITDMAMPRMTGLEVARAVHGIRPDVPIAITSGYGEQDAAGIRAANITTRIRKPVTLATLGRALRELFAAPS